MSENALGRADQVRAASRPGSESDNDGGGAGQSDLPGDGRAATEGRVLQMEAKKDPAKEAFNSTAFAQFLKAARTAHTTWPGQNDLQRATKGRFALHSQSVQMIVHAFLANIEATHTLRATHPKMRMKYPRKTKRFYPVHWPAQAVSRERARIMVVYRLL